MGVTQFFHDSVEDLASVKPEGPLIFDLCLDLFNYADDMMFKGKLWTDEDVKHFIDKVEHHIRKADTVTVSLSFGYSGCEADTRHLADLVVPKVMEVRGVS